MKKITEIETLASSMVGDGQTPDLFFVTDRGVVTTVTTDFEVASCAWGKLRCRYPLIECALENRTFGIIADVSPDEEGVLMVSDNSSWFRRDTCTT